jgi:two-component system, cell cycle response regulator
VRAAPKRASTQTALDLPKLRSRDPHARDQDVPAKVLLVDDDELELSLMADRLGASGFQVTVASNGEEALKILEHEWFPLILTDWQMPVMDGLQLVEKLRERGGDDSYFIMLSVRATSEDFERGYCAGVDDYLSKKSPDTEIMARIEAGLSTVALRRSLRQSRAALAINQSQQAATFANAKLQLVTRLQSEMGRARRYQRACSVLILGVHPSLAVAKAEGNIAVPALIDDTVRMEFMQALQGVIRVDIDTVVLYESGERHVQLAIVLPETGPAEVAAIRGRVRAAIVQTVRKHVAMIDAFDVSVGAASVDPSVDRAGLMADELLAAAENCRRCMASCGARRLAAVQTSVVSQVSIPCRHGYAVADHCLELDHRYAAETLTSAPVHAPHSSATPPAA